MAASRILVSIPGLGDVNGARSEFPAGPLDAFFGIPYAKPPVGDLRFQPPVPLEGEWNGALDATRLPDSCCQVKAEPEHEMWNLNANFSEDCLYLNIWRPGTVTSPDERRAVLVWIYGGGFHMGSSTRSVNDGSMLALKGDVVVVSMNYRVGPLGFLAVDDASAPGNVGLLDQQLALRWVHDHIAAFGGDPGRVTLFGESAGGQSVGFHLLSPGSESLFRYAIMQSGVATCPYAVYTNDIAHSKALELAKILGCPVSSNEPAAIVDFMRKLDPDVITSAQWRVPTEGTKIKSAFRPTVDGRFLPEHPLDLVRSGQFRAKNILLGVNLDEGSAFIPRWFPEYFDISSREEPDESKISLADYRRMVRRLRIMEVDASDATVEAVASEYLHPAQDTNSTDRRPVTYFGALSDMFGDVQYKCPSVEVAEAYKQKSPVDNNSVYFYTFNHRTSENPRPIWSGSVPHMYEMDSVFGRPWHPVHRAKYTDSERQLSERIIRFWTNFAKTGDPNLCDDGEETVDNWPQYNSIERLVLVLDTTERLQTQRGLRDRQCDFWANVVPKLQQAPAGAGMANHGPGVLLLALLLFLLLNDNFL